jgi:integrase
VRTKKRSTESLIPVSMSYIVGLCEKVDNQSHEANSKGLNGEEQKLRNKALISLLYLSARRVSELCGRTLKEKDTGQIVDVWEGVKVKDFRVLKRTSHKSIIMRVRILKKGRISTWREKGSLPAKVRELELSLKDKPFIDHVLNWLVYLGKKQGEEALLFDIDRTQAWRNLHTLDADVWNHWLRHMRLSHLGEFLNPYELQNKIGFWESIEPAIHYVHSREKPYQKALDKARKAFR